MAYFTPDALADGGSTFGNMRVVCGVLTSNGSGNAVATNLDYVAGFTVVPKSCNTDGASTLWSKSAGSLTPATSVSGQDFYVTAWGL